jgi:hypothetical protein
MFLFFDTNIWILNNMIGKQKRSRVAPSVLVNGLA